MPNPKSATAVFDEIFISLEESYENIIKRHGGDRRSRLKILRRILGLTQTEFAEAYGLPYATVRNWEQPDKGAPNEAGSLLVDLILEEPKTMHGLITKVRSKQMEDA